MRVWMVFCRDRVLALARLVCALGVAALAACAGPQPAAPQAQSDLALPACQRWMQRLDAVTDAHGVRDGAAARLPGLPHWRADRLLASFAPEAGLNPARWQAWRRALARLDAQARVLERANLPEAALAELGVRDRAAVAERTQACAEQAQAALDDDPVLRAALQSRAGVPDDYADWQRALGLYPLTRWPFFAGVERWQRQWSERLQSPPPAASATQARRYLPETPPEDAASVRALLASLPRDALGLARPDGGQAKRLLQAHAPVWQVAGGGTLYNRIGRVRWGPGVAPEVDVARPVVYGRIAHTRYGQKTLLQLVYSAWFTERPSAGGFDLLSGAVDAVVVRLTLADDGTPLLADSIHACGCYHLFVPGPGLRRLPPPSAAEEWAFAPIDLPAMAPGGRLQWRLATGSHMVEGVEPVQMDAGPGDGAGVVTYALDDENGLRSLPQPDGGRRSAFGPTGIMPGTGRGERWLFWPMGIASPGAMRQWGRQPTAFVGRRHFDDARLLEQRFEWLDPAR